VDAVAVEAAEEVENVAAAEAEAVAPAAAIATTAGNRDIWLATVRMSA